MATPAMQNVFTDNLYAPLCTNHNIVTASTRSAEDGFGCAGEVDSPRPRLTREQVFVLEKQFMENNKPTTAMRFSIALKTGFSMQQVGNWFQDRRVKAKVQKRQEELQVMQVLESASRRRVTEPSSPTHHQPAPRKAPNVTGRRRAKSDSATVATVHSVEMPSFSPYSSPTDETSFIGGINEYSHVIPQAALGRVPIFPEHNNSYLVQSVETPQWQQPASAFSDWGSSRNSIAVYTPTPAGQLEDPFEFDNPTNNQTAQSPFDTHAPVQDNLNMFAAAIEMNQYNKPFVMPAFPTSGLMKRRQMSPLCAKPQNTSSLRDSCPSELVDVFSASISSDQMVQHSEVQPSLAKRRKQACPALLRSGPPSSRSKSFSDALPDMGKETTTETKSMRRLRSTEDQRAEVCHGLATKSSTFNLNVFNTPIGNDNASLQLPPLSLPRDLQPLQDDEGSCCSPTPSLKQERIPDLDFSGNSVTPESATFDNHMPSVTLLPDTYQMHLPEHQLYIHMGLPNYYDFPSEGSSASSGILLSKEKNAFPFEEFLSARLNIRIKPLDGAADPQQPLVFDVSYR